MAHKATLILPKTFLLLLEISILVLPHCAVLGQPMMMMMMNTQLAATTHQLITHTTTTTTTDMHVEISNLGMSCTCSRTIVQRTESTHLRTFKENSRRSLQPPRERVEIEIELKDFTSRARRGGGDRYGAINGPWTSSWPGASDHHHVAGEPIVVNDHMKQNGHQGLVVQDAVMSSRSRVPTRKNKKVHGHVDDGYGEAYLPYNIQYV